MKRPTGPSIYANRKWIFSGTKHHLDNKINLRLCSQNQNLNFHCSFVTSSSLSHHTTMASLHSSFLLTSNFLSLTTPSSFPTHILFPVRLSTTHLRPLLLTTRHGFGRSPRHRDRGGREEALRWQHSPHCHQQRACQDCSRTWCC
ncbi:hypothetical protein AAZX31_08G150000 [Glycine max]|nr:hypothetical protein GLYMA_08G151750v4 [Glycine max]KAH1051340.1 hypothetical protein GYH30_021314 [Glycine max]